MSGGSGDYYSSSSTSRSSRGGTRREDNNRDDEQDLPRLRDVLREQFYESYEPAYNLTGMGRALPQSSRSPQPSLRLPPIREPPSRGDYGYTTSNENPITNHQDRAHTSSRTQNPPRAQPTNQPIYHVLAPTSAGGSLVPVSTSHTRPPGIVRGHVVTAGLASGDDAKKRFECQVCGRKMERRSVYNQHMLTHTDERPYACSYCPKTFNSKSNLNRHTLTHSNRWVDEDSTDNHDQGSSSKDYYTSSRRA